MIPWQDWNASAGFTRTAYRDGLPKTRAGVRYTSTLFREQVGSREQLSTVVDTHPRKLKGEKRGERAQCPCGRLSGIRGAGQSSLLALSRLWVIRSAAWRWGLAFVFFFLFFLGHVGF